MKSITLALCVVAILGSAASTFFYFQIGNTKEELQEKIVLAENKVQTLDGQLTESKAKKRSSSKRLAELDNDLGDAKSKVTSSENRSAQFSREVAQLRNQLTAKNEAEQALNREIGDLKREIAQAKLAGSASPEEIDGYKNTITALQARVAELEARRNQAPVRVTSTVASTAESSTPASVSTETTQSTSGYSVASVGANNAFVVINAGSAQGVQPNQRLSITRNGNPVAEAVVSSAQAGFSIAQVVTGSLQAGLMKGDSASLIQ